MPRIIDYPTLLAEVNDFGMRAYSDDKMDTFLSIIDGELALQLGANYEAQIDATITTDADGIAPLPADFVRFVALRQPARGNLNLVPWETLGNYNPANSGGVPAYCAIEGDRIKAAPIYAGNLSLTYVAKLTGLSSNSPTNWLLNRAPQVYFFALMGQCAAYEEDATRAAIYEQRWRGALASLGLQSMVAQHGRSRYVARGPTP